MKIQGTEVIKKKGETMNKALERTRLELYAEQQKQTYFATVPASGRPRVVGLDYEPI